MNELGRYECFPIFASKNATVMAKYLLSTDMRCFYKNIYAKSTFHFVPKTFSVTNNPALLSAITLPSFAGD